MSRLESCNHLALPLSARRRRQTVVDQQERPIAWLPVCFQLSPIERE
jgi:hypothetical protein